MVNTLKEVLDQKEPITKEKLDELYEKYKGFDNESF